MPVFYDMDMNGFMVIGVKPENITEYDKDSWHTKKVLGKYKTFAKRKQQSRSLRGGSGEGTNNLLFVVPVSYKYGRDGIVHVVRIGPGSGGVGRAVNIAGRKLIPLSVYELNGADVCNRSRSDTAGSS